MQDECEPTPREDIMQRFENKGHVEDVEKCGCGLLAVQERTTKAVNNFNSLVEEGWQITAHVPRQDSDCWVITPQNCETAHTAVTTAENEQNPATEHSTDFGKAVVAESHEGEEKCGRCGFRHTTQYRLATESSDLAICGDCFADWLITEEARVTTDSTGSQTEHNA